MIRVEVLQLLRLPKSPSISDWNKVLTLFENKKDELNWVEKRLLRCQSEWFRRYFNRDRIEVTYVTYGNGETERKEKRYAGLNIRREEVTPDIYSDCELRNKLLNGAADMLTAPIAYAIRLT